MESLLKKPMQDYCDTKEWNELNKDELMEVIGSIIKDRFFLVTCKKSLKRAFKYQKTDLKRFKIMFDCTFDNIVDFLPYKKTDSKK